MFQFAKYTLMASFAMMFAATTAFGAQGDLFTYNAGPIGAGLVLIGAGYGIGRLAASALEGMARQPEVAGKVQVGMIIAAALIEGATFYALFICSQG